MLAYCIDSASDIITCILKQGPTYLDVNASTYQPDLDLGPSVKLYGYVARGTVSDRVRMGSSSDKRSFSDRCTLNQHKMHFQPAHGKLTSTWIVHVTQAHPNHPPGTVAEFEIRTDGIGFGSTVDFG